MVGVAPFDTPFLDIPITPTTGQFEMDVQHSGSGVFNNNVIATTARNFFIDDFLHKSIAEVINSGTNPNGDTYNVAYHADIDRVRITSDAASSFKVRFHLNVAARALAALLGFRSDGIFDQEATTVDGNGNRFVQGDFSPEAVWNPLSGFFDYNLLPEAPAVVARAADGEVVVDGWPVGLRRISVLFSFVKPELVYEDSFFGVASLERFWENKIRVGSIFNLHDHRVFNGLSGLNIDALGPVSLQSSTLDLPETTNNRFPGFWLSIDNNSDSEAVGIRKLITASSAGGVVSISAGNSFGPASSMSRPIVGQKFSIRPEVLKLRAVDAMASAVRSSHIGGSVTDFRSVGIQGHVLP